MTAILLVLALLIAVVMLRGLLTPSVTYTSGITVDREIDTVFTAFMDYERVPEWLGGLQKIEALEGTPGEAGFKMKYTFEEGGRRVEFQEEVLEVVRPDSFTFLMESDDMDMQVTTRLSPSAGGTAVSMHNTVTAQSFMMKLLMPWLKGTMQSRQEEDLRRFKKMVES